MLERIQQKIGGQEVSLPPEAAPESKIIDLMEALKASVNAKGAARGAPRRASKRTKTSAKAKAPSRRKG
jgi:non-homologous end joining protein Ku